MRSIFRNLCLVGGLVSATVGCRPESSVQTEVRPILLVHVAASLTDVVPEVAERFAEEYPAEFIFNFASSGALAQQIMASSQGDLFLSASTRWMDAVVEAGNADPADVTAVLSNRLCVIANPASTVVWESPEAACDAPFELLAIGDPASVPAGRYAKKWLETVACADRGTLWERWSDRLSPTPDVRAVLAQVEGNRDLFGIVYETDFVARREHVRLLHTVPVEGGPPITYAAAVLSESRAPKLARAFLDYLRSEEAAAIFREHGFTPVVPEE